MITQDKEMQTIEINNVGPNKRLSIPWPKGGGLVVLKGTNDLGKSEAINAVDAVVNDRGGIEVTRGAVSGSIHAFGVSVKIGKRTTRTGEATVEGLEGRFSIEDLIEPKLKDELARDAKRIKTLIQIRNTTATAATFHGLLGGKEEFEKIVSKTAVDSDDFVVMAERIKRDIEKECRKLEEQANHEDGHAKGALAATAGVDMDAESDATKLQSAHERAVRRDSELTAKGLAHKTATIKARKASDALGDAESTYDGPTLAVATAAETTAKTTSEQKQEDVRQLESQLTEARTKWEASRTAYSAAITARKQAEQHESTLGTWREQIAASVPDAPDDEEIVAANEAVSDARKALEDGAVVRRARESRATAEKHAALAGEHRKKAMRLREAAHGVDDILSGLVGSGRFRVEGGRLMVTTESTPKTYDELSHGKRSRLAIAEAIEACGPNSVIPLQQEFFEGIAPARRKDIAEQLKGTGVLMLTAMATDDEEIVAEIM